MFRQASIRYRNGTFELAVGELCVRRIQDGDGMCSSLAEHDSVTDSHIAHELGLNPLWADIAAEAGNEHVLESATHIDETIRIDLAEITGLKRIATLQYGCAHVAIHERTADKQLPA
jgi:hypothetical protein